MVLHPQSLIAEETRQGEVAGRNSLNVDHLLGSRLSLERTVVQTDDSLAFKSIFNLVVVVFKPFVIEPLLHKRQLFPWLFFGGQAIRHIWRNREWCFLIGKAHLDGMGSKLQHDGLAALVLQLVDIVAFGLQVLDGVLHGLLGLSHGDDYSLIFLVINLNERALTRTFINRQSETQVSENGHYQPSS